MRAKEFEKIVSAIESIDQNFPEMARADIRIVEYRRNLLQVTVDGLKLLQVLKSEEAGKGGSRAV